MVLIGNYRKSDDNKKHKEKLSIFTAAELQVTEISI